MRNDFESNYLMHHGILGQKWGSKNGPPYPLDEGDHSAREKKAGWMKSLAKAAKDHKVKKQRKKALKKAQEARKEQLAEKKKEKAFAKDKEKILRSGDPALIMKYRKQLTDNEIQSALNRVRNENEFKRMIKESEKSGFDKIDDIMKKAGKVSDWAETGIKAYDRTAEIYNTFFAKSESEKWPSIRGEKESARSKLIKKVINSRDPAEIKKYSSMMTNDELKNAMKGLDYKSDLDNDYSSWAAIRNKNNKNKKKKKDEDDDD